MKLIRAQHRPWLVYTAFTLLSLAILTSHMRGGIISNRLEAVVLNMMTPVYSTVNWSLDKVTSYWNNYVSLVDVRIENRNLKNKLGTVQERLLTLNDQAQSAQRLRGLLTRATENDHQILMTEVVRRSNSLLNATMLINAGSANGLRQGNGVANMNGAIGQVVRTGPEIAKVITLHHPDAGIGALLEKSRVQGVVSGTGTGNCVMRFVSRFDPVILGETVVTSGLDGAFPKGIPIGRVAGIERDPGEIFQTIDIIPVSDVNTLEEVIVYLLPEFDDESYTESTDPEAKTAPDAEANPDSNPVSNTDSNTDLDTDSNTGSSAEMTVSENREATADSAVAVNESAESDIIDQEGSEQ